MVDVSSQNNSVSVNVSTGGTSASIKATPDMAQYYSEKSREWAISNRIVENIDYSSKYYAEKSKESATSALNSAEQAKSVKEQAIEEINSLKDVATNEIQDVAINATSDVTDVKIEAISNILTSTQEAVEQIEQEGLEQFNKVKSTGFYMRDDKLYFINSKGEEEEFKSGGMPTGAIYPLVCTNDYVPDGSLPTDGAEYTEAQFKGLWKDYLTSEEKTWQINKNADYSAELEFLNGVMSGVGEFNFKISNTDDEIVYKFLVNDLSVMQTLINFGEDDEFGILYGDSTQNIPYFGYLGTGVQYFELTTNEFYVKFSRHELVSTGWLIALSYDNKTWQTYTSAVDGGSEDILTKITFNNQFSVDLINSYIVNNNIITYLAEEKQKSLLNTCTYAEYENELATYGQCGKFAIDVENNTFRVPLIKDGAVIQQALTNDELGKAYNAGLPNITGTIFSSRLRSKTNEQKTGAFSNSGSITKANAANNDAADSNSYSIDFDASLSNPIYGNSETVQMNAVALRHFVVVANGQINESMMDWSEWASSLQGKANVDGSNFNESVKNIDGQWVQSFYAVATTSGTLNGVQYDLSEYLPNDNYAYDVKFNIGAYDDDSSYYYYIQTDIFDSGHTDTSNSDYKQLHGGTYSRQNRIILDLPVGTGRYVKLYGSGADDLSLKALGYRRIGTNK